MNCPPKKRERLDAIIEDLGSVAVACSGGVDSSLVLAEAARVLGPDHVLAVTATGPVYLPEETEAARKLAENLGINLVVLESDQLQLRHFAENPSDRCYHCKLEIFGEVQRVATERGIAAVADGANADDPSEHRPGLKAAEELGVRSPLKEAGLGKDEIRALSRELGLATWNRPSMACLASRFPYGTAVTAEALERVRAAEAVLGEFGFEGYRVRHHGDLARIEVAPDDVERLVAVRGEVVGRLKALGYTYVTCDLEGYRSGAMDEALGDESST